MTEDVVRSLGYLALGSRFRRIGERLQADTQRILDELDRPLQSSHHPFLAALDRLGPLTIGELAEAVGVTQPGATRSVGQMTGLGLVRSRSAPDDQRRRIVSLTEAGQTLVDTAKATVWPRVERAVADLCGHLEGPLLDQLASMEDGLADRPLHRRLAKSEKVKNMKHLLDRPVWTALASRHAALAEGGPRARRYPATIVPFASTEDDSEESLAALDRLVAPGETIYMAQADPILLPAGLAATFTAAAVQMLAESPLEKVADERIRPLGPADAAEMLELATLTKPGPFTLRAMDLGEFFGIRIDGRLAAMAGERMKQTGFTELSGVCVHPDFRGQGLARLLSLFVAGRITARGEAPYLHAYATNTAAIRLYERIGFELRTEMHIAVVQRAG